MPERKPNFLFIITDQHRADYLGCYGHPVVRTPHIDGLAARGVSFDRFFVASPVCMPNRASLLTGRYPSAHGLRHNGNRLSTRANTFVDVLRESGYRTALIGKSHVQPMTGFPAEHRISPDELGPITEAWRDDAADYDQEDPARYKSERFYDFKTPYYGFDHVDMVTDHGDRCNGHYYQWLRQQEPRADQLRDRANQLAHDYECPQAIRTPLPERLYPTAFITQKAKTFLKNVANKDRPFFAFVSFPDPHHPFTPPGRYWDMYNPSQFSLPPSYEDHKNPPPPLRWAHERLIEGNRDDRAQEAFMARPRELREAMALTCGMITMIDDAVGDLLNTLKETGQDEDTVVVFNSDHGDYLGHFSLLLKGPLPFNSISRVPFIWSDPQNPNGGRTQSLTSTIDIAPTIVARAGLKPYWGMQGKSALPSIERPGAETRENLLIEFQDGKPRMGFSEPAFVRTIIGSRYKLNLYKNETWGELYDLEKDPDETNNLWSDSGSHAVRAEMTELLVRQMMEAVDQSPRALRRA